MSLLGDGYSQTKHFQNPSQTNGTTYADQKSKIMTHNIHVSQLHHVHQTQYFNEWVGFRPFKLQIKFLQGSEFFQKYIDGNGNWFYPTET